MIVGHPDTTKPKLIRKYAYHCDKILLFSIEYALGSLISTNKYISTAHLIKPHRHTWYAGRTVSKAEWSITETWLHTTTCTYQSVWSKQISSTLIRHTTTEEANYFHRTIQGNHQRNNQQQIGDINECCSTPAIPRDLTKPQSYQSLQ